MKANIVMSDKYATQRAITAISRACNDGIHVMTIKPYKKDRALTQNRLMWHWYKELEQQRDANGMTKDDLVNYNKLTFGVPILSRGDDFNEMWQSTKYLSYEQKLNMMRFIPITSIMNITQMTEYLTDFKTAWNQQGVHLTTIEDLYFEAMGIKR